MFEQRVIQDFRPLFSDELLNLIPEWQRLSDVANSHVEVHTYRVTFLTWIDPRLAVMTPKQAHTLIWSALLHDIAKRSTPEFFGKDHTHPFAGGLVVLKVFHRIGFL